MQDRVPTKPNRYAVYDDAHNFVRYEYHERADEPAQIGDALNKANLLSDATENAIWGSTGNRTVDAALSRLKTDALKIATGSYVGTGTYGEANPCSLAFDITPRLFWLIEADYYGRQVVAIYPYTTAKNSYYNGVGLLSNIIWGANSISFVNSSEMNMADITYFYAALGSS